MKDIKRCARCIMDNSSDETITFDENGRCNYCTDALARKSNIYFPNEEGQAKLSELLRRIKIEGKNKEYDCLMGISGGLDSSYLAYLGSKWGLRIVAVHVDDGFDTETSKKNIKKLIDKTKIKFIETKPDPIQYHALTKAYMRAGVPNLAVPQDNVLFTYLYDYARENGIKYFLSGSNFSLECILQRGNTYDVYDMINIRDINQQFGTEKIDRLKMMSAWRMLFDRKVLGLVTATPLNYIEYNRDKALKELYDFCGFEYYGRKHLENILTAFIQLYWFPKKFNVDKRTSHLSSMIVSGQITRDEAIKELAKPLDEEVVMEEYVALVKERLCISDAEFDAIMQAPSRQHTDYKTDALFIFVIHLYSKFKKSISNSG